MELETLAKFLLAAAFLVIMVLIIVAVNGGIFGETSICDQTGGFLIGC